MASSTSAEPPAPSLTTTQWLIVTIAAIGFAFDIYELLMVQLVGPPLLQDLLGFSGPPTDEAKKWRAIIFYVPALVGGFFGLIGGYLTDRLGRRRVLTFSIMLYALSAFASGFSTSVEMFLILRCLTFIGVCLEFVAAVAWLAELFPHPVQREKVLGYTQAFSSIGGLLVAVVYGWIVANAKNLPPVSPPDWLLFGGVVNDPNAAWRFTLMSGVIPAIPLIIIRPFLPESPVWQQKKESGKLRRPSFREVFTGPLRRTTIVTTLMVACGYGVAFGAIQSIPEIVKGLDSVKVAKEAAWEAEKGAAKPRPKPVVERQAEQAIVAEHTTTQEVGGLTGRFLLAILALYIVSRRGLIRVFLVPGLIIVPLIFAYFLAMPNPNIVLAGCFLAGLFTVAQFSFWGNYLPRVYPTHLRGTGESVAANVGGRMMGTSFAAIAAGLVWTSWFFPGIGDPQRYAYAGAIIAGGLFLSALFLSFFLPQPTEELPE